MNLFVSAIGQGLLYGILSMGLFLSFRILRFPDMTVEGSFAIGAAVCVAAISHGISPLFATILAALAGGLAGLVTGLLYTKGHIPVLLAGILVMTASYSINLRIMGKANSTLLNLPTLMSSSFLAKLSTEFRLVFIGLIAVILAYLTLSYFLKTDLGQAFIATGDNEVMAESLGIHTQQMKIIGLIVSNGLVGLAAGLIAQNDGYADVNMGTGTIVIALAAIVIGEVVYGELTMNQRLLSVICGSIIYRFIILIVLKLGLNTNDLKLISAILLAVIMMMPQLKTQFQLKTVIQKGVQTK